MRRTLNRSHRAFVPNIAAAVESRIRVGNFLPCPGQRYANPIVVPRRRRHVANDKDGFAALGAKAEESEYGIGAVIANHPAELAAMGIALMQGGFAAVDAVEVAHKPLDAGMVAVAEQMPFDFGIVIPFAPLRDLAAHEQQLLAGMRPHEAEIRTQVGELLPTIAGHLADQRMLPVHDLVMRERQDEFL